MAQSGQTGILEAIERTVKKPPHEFLFQLGGALAILLGLVAFGVQWSQGIAGNRLAGLVVVLLVDLILGAVLAFSVIVVRKNVVNGAILGGAIGLVLALFGGIAGVVGGILGILGAIVAFAGPYLSRVQRA